MEPPDDLCVCFHVPIHKIAKFIRLERPRFPSQCSECYGAGTGCGWCIPFIEKLFEEVTAGGNDSATRMSGEEYRARRLEYLERIKAERLRLKEPEEDRDKVGDQASAPNLSRNPDADSGGDVHNT
ncbi:(2Fe-2S)-binding protein [Candidatus Poribacteria bacterium]|nr:(2Fe-2S)-binding protein [Candidatus Poribacteria bacterium]